MSNSTDNGWNEGNGAEEDESADPITTKGASKAAKALVQFSSGLSRPFIQRPVMTMLLTASIIVFGILMDERSPSVV